MEAVKVVCVYVTEHDKDVLLANVLKRVMKYGGYGYDKVVHTSAYGDDYMWVLLADEYVTLTSKDVDTIENFYNGITFISAYVTEGGKLLDLLEI